LAPGYNAQTALVRGAPSTDLLKANVIGGLSPEEQKTALAPKDATLQAARENLLATLAFKGQENEANRGLKELQLKQQELYHQGILEQRAATEAGRQDMRNFMKTNLTARLENTTDAKKAQQMATDLGKLSSLESQIAIASGKDKETLQAQANKFIDTSPHLAGYPKWEKDIPIPGTGILGTNFRADTQKVPVGSPAAKPPAGRQQMPSMQFPLTLRNKTTGAEQVVNNLEEYNRLMGK
jgi:hypothetical protein